MNRSEPGGTGSGRQERRPAGVRRGGTERAVANAPVSYGVFELAPTGPPFVAADVLLTDLADAGYDGVDLGPPGYLGDVDAIAENLTAHRLALAGGWISLRFPDAAGFADDLGELDRLLDLFVAAAAAGAPPPKPTLADAGSPIRRANPGRGWDRPEIRLPDADWGAFAARVSIAADHVRRRGLEPTFHHHACTYVEAPVEIERLLELTDIGLCLDTGHLLLGGGDPMRAWDSWRARINHLHVKDCRMDVLQRCVAEGASMESVWSQGVFCALGAGDLDVEAFLGAVCGSDYAGWLVVEQDVIPGPHTTVAAITAEQRHNREVVRRHGF